jgi:hypothetical protein
MLCFIYVILVIGSILLIISSLNSYLSTSDDNDKDHNQKKEKCDLLISTVHHLKDKYQLLIIPLTLWLGFSLAFIGADFTKSFVACSLGVDLVGYAMIFFGLTDVIGSYAFGILFKVSSLPFCLICFNIKLNKTIEVYWKNALFSNWCIY